MDWFQNLKEIMITIEDTLTAFRTEFRGRSWYISASLLDDKITVYVNDESATTVKNLLTSGYGGFQVIVKNVKGGFTVEAG